MELSINTRQAYSEIDEFLGLITEEERNEIPKKLRDFFKEEKDTSYRKNINSNIPIKEQNLKEETLAIIALLNLQYWCKDEDEKQRLQQIYANNENKYQAELRKKYNPDNIFKNRVKELEQEKIAKDVTALVEYKEENFIKKLINRIKRFLKK